MNTNIYGLFCEVLRNSINLNSIPPNYTYPIYFLLSIPYSDLSSGISYFTNFNWSTSMHRNSLNRLYLCNTRQILLQGIRVFLWVGGGIIAGPHRQSCRPLPDLLQQKMYVCRYVCMWSDSSGDRASDCRSMGRWFEPHLW